MSQKRIAYESALVILVPEAEALVGRWRRRYDPSAAVGMPAHITINYPFLPGRPVDAATIAHLGPMFAGLQSIRYALVEVREFFDTVYLAPEPAEPFMDLIRAVVAHYPQSPPYGGMFAEVVPHLSLAQSENAAELEQVLGEFAPGSDGHLPIDATAEEVWLMDNRSGRWEKRISFRLGTPGPG
jgi:hypothetical protein